MRRLNPWEPPNARFWVWWRGGYVKLTLKPGQSITAHQGGRTEEGWSSETDTYSHEGDYIANEFTDDGRDCDGRLTRTSRFICPLGKLRAVSLMRYIPSIDCYAHVDHGELGPAWQKREAWQRDEYAQAAGY